MFETFFERTHLPIIDNLAATQRKRTEIFFGNAEFLSLLVADVVLSARPGNSTILTINGILQSVPNIPIVFKY